MLWAANCQLPTANHGRVPITRGHRGYLFETRVWEELILMWHSVSPQVVWQAPVPFPLIPMGHRSSSPSPSSSSLPPPPSSSSSPGATGGAHRLGGAVIGPGLVESQPHHGGGISRGHHLGVGRCVCVCVCCVVLSCSKVHGSQSTHVTQRAYLCVCVCARVCVCVCA